MIIEPENHELAGIGIREGKLAQRLKRMRAGFLGIRIDPMRYFKAIDVSAVLKLAADSAADGLRDRAQNREDQEQHGQTGPVAEVAHVPALLETGKCPS